jgi:flagellum-specific peptidoglycan hydrolase FlgJ
MTFFKYNHDHLKYDKVCIKTWVLYLLSISLVLFISGYVVGSSIKKEIIVEEFTEAEQIVFIQEVDTFSQDALTQMLVDLNVKFPHIVMAQSMLETGHWRSNIFLENHNLFGMKQARRRITTAEGTSRNHAYYNHWRESVYDYAFYQCRYLGTINSEDAYFQYLDASYAEAEDYVPSLKRVIEKEKLRELFE